MIKCLPLEFDFNAEIQHFIEYFYPFFKVSADFQKKKKKKKKTMLK